LSAADWGKFHVLDVSNMSVAEIDGKVRRCDATPSMMRMMMMRRRRRRRVAAASPLEEPAQRLAVEWA